MKKLLVLSTVILLSACTRPEAPVETPPVTATPPAEQTQTDTQPQNAILSLHYTLHEDSPTGKVIDTSREEIAKEAGIYKTGSQYEPLQVVLGTQSVVPGFEANIATMKKGEKKSFVVEPKDGYGEATSLQTVQKYQVAPEFTLNVAKSDLSDTITESVQRSALGDAGKDIKEGQTLTGGQDMVATIKKIDGETVTLEIVNKGNPFFGKKVEVGAVSEQNGAKYTITSMTDTGVVLTVSNSKSPFAGKKFEAGTIATIPDPMTGQDNQIKVVSMSGELVTIEVPNGHPLAGKKLYFDVEILDIK